MFEIYALDFVQFGCRVLGNLLVSYSASFPFVLPGFFFSLHGTLVYCIKFLGYPAQVPVFAAFILLWFCVLRSPQPLDTLDFIWMIADDMLF